MPPDFYDPDGYYSNTYETEYYDGYGKNFYYGTYGYYEYSRNYGDYEYYFWGTDEEL